MPKKIVLPPGRIKVGLMFNAKWRTVGNTLIFAMVLALTTGVTFWIFNIIYAVQPTPFLDEIFHIPQTIQFCQGNFSHWNPKITTLPGLYGISIVLLIPLGMIVQFSTICTVYTLRFTNYLAFLANFYLLYDLHKRINGSSKVFDFRLLFSSLNLVTFPVLYFFTFLYYTDSVSTTLVLLMYDLNLAKRMKISAVIGAAACMVRQSNIIWVGFLMLETFPEIIVRQVTGYKRELFLNKKKVGYFKVLNKCLKDTMEIGGLPASSKLLFEYLAAVKNYMMVCALFVTFMFLNGGIVVGDRAAHSPSIHVLQICYFAAFTVVMAAPYFISDVIPFLKAAIKSLNFIMTTWFFIAIFVHFFTIEHPYLLADNRHYVFYVWQRVYRSHFLIRYALIFVYIFAIIEIIKKFTNANVTFRLHYFVCLTLFLVPQSLLEFRYFIIPYLLFRLNVAPTGRQLIAEFCWYSLINAFTVYLFVTKTFYWPDSEEKQRIIW